MARPMKYVCGFKWNLLVIKPEMYNVRIISNVRRDLLYELMEYLRSFQRIPCLRNFVYQFTLRHGVKILNCNPSTE